MNILITGGLGGVGRPLVQRLLRHGHAVRVLDLAIEPCIANVECVAGDVTDFATVREHVRDMDAIIHLAALTHPAAGPAHEIFRINCAGTFNIYDAAAQEGIRRVVCASSINALGFNFGMKPFAIEYFPLDEAHPSYTTDAYSFSKRVVEDIADYFLRRDGITGTQLRMPFVYGSRSGMQAVFKQFFARAQQALNEFQQLPEAEQQARAARIVAERDQQRTLRLSEKPWDQREDRRSPEEMEPLMSLMAGYTDFWAVLSGEDAAQAFELSVTANYEGSHPLYVCEDRNSVGVASEKLATLFFLHAARKRPLADDVALVSIEKARQLIGFAPKDHISNWMNAG